MNHPVSLDRRVFLRTASSARTRAKCRLAFQSCTLLLILFIGPVAIAHPPTGIVVDSKGNVYFSDLETVWKLDTHGRLTVFRAGVSGRHVHELSIDANDNIYGADLSYESQTWISDVWQMSSEGKFTYLLEPTRNPPKGMSLLRDRDGNMYFVDQNNHTKKQTLLLRRTPDGKVTTLAGSAYGHLDGKGTEARFSSIGGMAFGPDAVLYLTDGISVRKVSMDGVVTTLATDLVKRTASDRPLLFGKNDGILTGLTIDASENVYVADAGNQRLLKINKAGEVSVVYRGESDYYANGVVATVAGDLYVLEVGFIPPATWLASRVRKIGRDGKNEIVATTRDAQKLVVDTSRKERVTSKQEPLLLSTRLGDCLKYVVALTALITVGLSFAFWKRRGRAGGA